MNFTTILAVVLVTIWQIFIPIITWALHLPEMNIFYYYVQAMLAILFLWTLLLFFDDASVYGAVKGLQFPRIIMMAILFSTTIMLSGNLVNHSPLGSPTPEDCAFAFFILSWLMFAVICFIISLIGVVLWLVCKLPPIKRRLEEAKKELEWRK